jgi:hypothetical protein
MTRDEVMIRALDAFDRIVAERERANISAMLLDDVDPDELDGFIGEARATMRQSREEYVAAVLEMLDGEW